MGAYINTFSRHVSQCVRIQKVERIEVLGKVLGRWKEWDVVHANHFGWSWGHGQNLVNDGDDAVCALERS